MMHNNLRCRSLAALIRFAPIRRAADDICGPSDIFVDRVQSNEFHRAWMTDEDLSYSEVRLELLRDWMEAVRHLRNWFDGVIVVDVELVVRFDVNSVTGPVGDLQVRRSVSGLGSVVTRITRNEATGGSQASVAARGHLGTPDIADTATWFDNAQAAIEHSVLSLSSKSNQNAPAREAWF